VFYITALLQLITVNITALKPQKPYWCSGFDNITGLQLYLTPLL